MPKGKSHSNREAKKPKQPKKPADLFAKGLQPGMGEKKEALSHAQIGVGAWPG